MAQTVNCVFCFKTIDGESELSNDDRETTAKFFKFLQRHLNKDIHHVNQDSMASLLIQGCDASGNILLDIDSCSSCSQLMSRFLDLYNQLKTIELKLSWNMQSLVNVMSTATKVSSYAKAFHDSLKNIGGDGDEEIMMLKGIHEFRKDLIKNCAKYYDELLPRVAIHIPTIYSQNHVESLQSSESIFKEPNLTEEVTNEQLSDLNSEPELDPSDNDDDGSFPGPCDQETFETEPDPLECSESFGSPSTLRIHQLTSHIPEEPLGMAPNDVTSTCDEQHADADNEKAEQEIIQQYANTPLEFLRKRNKYYPPNLCIKTLSEHLSPTQQRLTAALLHQPRLLCHVTDCSEKIVFKNQLESHSKLHGKFSCTSCSHEETYAPKLAEHVLTQHCSTIVGSLNSRPVLCCMPVCAKLAAPVQFHEKGYVFHYLTDHLNLDASTIGCPICHYISPRNLALTVDHFQTHHNILQIRSEDVRQCEKCPAYFSDSHNLRMHLLSFHNYRPMSCHDCKKTFEDKNWYIGHRHRCEARPKYLLIFSCPFPNCGRKFDKRSASETHKKECKFAPGAVIHECVKCKKQFYNITSLNKHLESQKHNQVVEAGDKRWKTCEVCGRRLSVLSMYRHMMLHAEPGSWNSKCPICGKECVSKAIYSIHMGKHGTQNLLEHRALKMKTHEFPCPECGKRFKCWRNVKAHIYRMHSKDSKRQAKPGSGSLSTPSALDRQLETQDNIPQTQDGERDDIRGELVSIIEIEETDIETSTLKSEIDSKCELSNE